MFPDAKPMFAVGRKPVIEPENFSHAIYLVVSEQPGLRLSDIRKVLKEKGWMNGKCWTGGNVTSSVKALHTQGILRYTQIKGTLDDADDRAKFRWAVTEKPYKPKPVMKKISAKLADVPVSDKKSDGITDKPKPELLLVKGIATVDPSNPDFREIATGILNKTDPIPATGAQTEIPSMEDVASKSASLFITGIFLEVGGQSLVCSPAQLKQLRRELNDLFSE